MSEPQTNAAAAGRLRRALPWVLLALCAAYAPIFFGQILFYRDPAHWTYPARFFVRAALLRGELPVWNPDQGLGFAVLANPLYALFYPGTWLYLLVPDRLVAHMTTWEGFLHLAWGTAGMVRLARRLGMREAGAAVAGLAWGLSGFTAASWTTGVLLLAGAHVPWCGLGFVALARAARAGGRALPAGIARAAWPLVLALLLGEVFVAAMAALFGIALGAIVLAVERPGAPGERRRAAAGGLAALALAGGVGAIVVLPARAIAGATDRAAPLSRALAEACSLHPLRLIEFAAPNAMGYAFGDYPAAAWVGEPLLDGLPLFYSAYMGASVLALALAAFGRGRRLGGALGLVALVALLLALGRHTPLFDAFRTLVRPFAYMRYPEKFLVLFVASLALLAGLGADRILAERTAPWRRTLVWLALLAALAALAVPLFPREWAPYVFGAAVRGAGAVAVVLGVQHLAVRGVRQAPLLLAMVVAVDLAQASFAHLGFGPSDVATRVPPAAAAVLADDRDRRGEPGPPRVYRANATEDRIRRFVEARWYSDGQRRSVQTLVPNLVNTYGLASVPGYDAAIPSLLSSIFDRHMSAGQAVLRLTGTGYVVLPVDDPRDPVERRRGLEPMMDPLPGARLYRVPDALPRVFLAGQAAVLPDGDALRELTAPEVVHGGRALLAPGPDAAPLEGEPTRAGACTLGRFSLRRIEARCRAERPALAVFVEQHAAGWRAEVNGRPAPLLRANLVMRAVRVPPGEHTLTLTYTPPAVAAAAVMSGTSVAVLLLLAVLGRRPRRSA